MFLFYVLNFFKKGDTIQEGTLLKEIQSIICIITGNYRQLVKEGKPQFGLA